MDNDSFDISVLSTETIKLWREIHTQKQFCKNLENVFKTMNSDIKTTYDANISMRSNIQDVFRRGNCVQNNISSTNKSTKLVDDLLCDLKKQLQLERIRTSEEAHKFNTVLLRYDVLWNNYQVINKLAFNLMSLQATYKAFPLAQDAIDLRVAVKQDSIQLVKCKVELAEVTRKMKTIEIVNEKQNKMKIIQMATLFVSKKTILAKKEALLSKIRTLRETVTALTHEKMELQQQEVIYNPPDIGETIEHHTIPMSKNISQFLMSSPQQSQSSICHQTQILSSLGSLPSLLSELPVLKIPVFNSPPRKVPRHTAASIRSLMHPSISSLRFQAVLKDAEPQTLSEPTPEPETAMDVTSGVELQFPISVNCTSEGDKDTDMETNTEPNAQAQTVEEEPAEEVGESEQQEQEANVTYNAENNVGDGVPRTVMEQNDDRLDDSFMNESPRMDYLLQLKSPEFHFSARPWRTDAECPVLSPSDDTSQYFQQSGQDDQMYSNDGQQSNGHTEGGGSVVSTGDSNNIDFTSPEGPVASPGTDSVDNLLSQYVSPTSPASSCLSPTLPQNYNQIQSAHQGAGDASGFCFNFGTESSKGLTSLFGGTKESEKEESKESDEAFKFSFNSKTKSSSFFKLF